MKQKKQQAESPVLTKEERFLGRLKDEIYSFFDLNYEQSYSLNQIHKAFAVKDRRTKELFQALVEDLTLLWAVSSSRGRAPSGCRP